MEKSGEVTIEMSPLYQDADEEIVHENFFQWRRHDGHAIFFDSIHKRTVVTFVRSYELSENVITVNWKNPHPVDLSGLPSLFRILMIRDITKRLRELDEQNEEANKLFTDHTRTTIDFKLEDTEFSFALIPTPNQPGNALLTMQSSIGEGPYRAAHWSVEEFDCFTKLDAKEIDSIVSRARGTGKPINDTDIIINEDDEIIKKKMAEQMTFFMLLNDFEVARRLQRPFINDSHYDLDSLPIGIGIAMIHRINSRREKKRWIFFSGLFVGHRKSRKSVLDEIVVLFKELNESTIFWTKEDLISLLDKQFGAARPVST